MRIRKFFWLASLALIIHANTYAMEEHSKIFLCFNQAGISKHWNTISDYIQRLPRGSKVISIVSRKAFLKPQLTFVELSSASLLSDHIVETQQKLPSEEASDDPNKKLEIMTIITTEQSSFLTRNVACFLSNSEVS